MGRSLKLNSGLCLANNKIIKILEQSPVAQIINTSYVERNNLSIRQHSRRLRKTNGFLKVKRNLDAQLILVMVYYNFVRPFTLLIKDQG